MKYPGSDTASYYIQPATAEQQQAIKDLIRLVQINPFGLDWSRFIVAMDEDGTLIGCGQIKPHRDGSRELASIAVRPEWRSQGVARAIIAQLLTEAPRPLWLTCLLPMASFYEPFGFQQITEPAQMTPHFRRISRFVRAVTRLVALVHWPRPLTGLAVMRLDP